MDNEVYVGNGLPETPSRVKLIELDEVELNGIDSNNASNNDIQIQQREYARTLSINPETPWFSISLVGLVLFLSSLQFTIYFSSTYPFMKQVDPTAPEGFFGWIIAIFSVGQMISSPIFGYLSNRFKNVRYPTVLGLFICAVGNLIYGFSQAFDGGNPHNHRWVLFVARFISGFGSGYAGPLRAYFATAARAEDRAKAISLGNGAFTMGFLVGPALQGLFGYVGYPGSHYGPININLYTSPCFFVVATLTISILLKLFVFKETYAGIITARKKSSPFFAMPKYDKVSVCLLIFNWFCVLFANTAIEVLMTPVSMVYYGWSNAQAVTYNGFLFAGSGGMSFICIVAYGYYFAMKFDERKMIIFGFVMALVYWVVSFPFPTESAYICPGSVACQCPYINSTVNSLGKMVNETLFTCAPFSWYENTTIVPVGVLFGLFPILSIGIPFITTPVSTHIARVVGPRRQATVQGLLMTAGSLARFIGPLFMSYSFEWYGPRAGWTLNMVIIVAAIVPWLFLYKRAIPLDPNPTLNPGENFKYKRGTLHRF